jgi:hypothetical protein
MYSSDFKPKQTRFAATLLCLHEWISSAGESGPCQCGSIVHILPLAELLLTAPVVRFVNFSNRISSRLFPLLPLPSPPVAGWINMLLECYHDKADLWQTGMNGWPTSLQLLPWQMWEMAVCDRIIFVMLQGQRQLVVLLSAHHDTSRSGGR